MRAFDRCRPFLLVVRIFIAATIASRHTLRYYEQIGLISPQRRTNNYRDYTTQTLHDLDFIKRAQSMGFSLGEIGEILDAQRIKLIEKKMIEVQLKIANLQSIYRYLDEERANLEASAAKQLELEQLNNLSGQQGLGGEAASVR